MSCAFSDCGDPECYLCTVVAKQPQPDMKRPREQEGKFKDVGTKPARHTEPKPMTKKRTRVGPHR